MGLLKTILVGRDDGIRAKIRRIFGGGGQEDTSPNSAYSAPGDAEINYGVTAGGANKLEPPKDVTPPDGFEVVLHRDALSPGEVTEVIIGGTAIAIANVDGTFYALSNACPHAGGPLGEGELKGSLLRCPYHGWTYDVADGRCQTNPDVQATTFEVHVEREAICVRL
jgi:nitrite reductase/ring-hydroxylating ferredoxin subunit